MTTAINKEALQEVVDEHPTKITHHIASSWRLNVSIPLIEDLLKTKPTVQFNFQNGDILIIDKTVGDFAGLGIINYIQVSFGDYGVFEDKQTWDMMQTQYFGHTQIEKAIDCFIHRLQSIAPYTNWGQSESLESIRNNKL